MRIQLYYLTAFFTAFVYGSSSELDIAKGDIAPGDVGKGDIGKGGNSFVLLMSRPNSKVLKFKSLRVLELRRDSTRCQLSEGASPRFITFLIGDLCGGAFRTSGGDVLAVEVVCEPELEEAFEEPDGFMVDELVGCILSTKVNE